MSVGDNIRELREREHLSQAELAKLLGVVKETVYRWEVGRTTLREGYAQRICELFQLSRDDLISDELGLAARRAMHESGQRDQSDPASRPGAVGVYRIVSSGSGTALQRFSYSSAPVDVAERHPGAFFVRLDDASMDLLYPKGSYLLVDPTLVPWNGCSVVALINGAEILIRKYTRGNDTVFLSASTFMGDYPDLYLNNRAIRIVGVVIWFQASHDLYGH